MPLVTMATPIQRSQVFLIPDPDPSAYLSLLRNKKRNIFLIKILELILVSASIIIFSLSTAASTYNSLDTFICVVFGICLIYPIFVLIESISYSSKNVVIFNLSGAVLLLVIGIALIISSASLRALLENSLITKPEIYNKSQHFINMKLMSGVLSLMNGVLYFGEATFIIMYNWSNVVV